jgi:thioester reductase-like protein
MTAPAAPPGKADDLERWMRRQLAQAIETDPAGLDFSRSIMELGLSSVQIVRLAGMLEEWLEIQIEPTALYDYRTVSELCTSLQAARAIQAVDGAGASRMRPWVIAATFTVAPLAAALESLAMSLGLTHPVRIEPYGAIADSLRSHDSEFARAADGIGVVVVRAEDWFRDELAPPSMERIDHVVGDFLQALGLAAERAHTPLTLALAPHLPGELEALGLAGHIADIDQALLDAATALPNVSVLDLRTLDQAYRLENLAASEEPSTGHIPYTPAGFDALAASVMRHIMALQGSTARLVMVTDACLRRAVFADAVPLLERQRTHGVVVVLLREPGSDAVMNPRDPPRALPTPTGWLEVVRATPHTLGRMLQDLALQLAIPLDRAAVLSFDAAELAALHAQAPSVIPIALPAMVPGVGLFLHHHWALHAPWEPPRPGAQVLALNSREHLPDTAGAEPTAATHNPGALLPSVASVATALSEIAARHAGLAADAHAVHRLEDQARLTRSRDLHPATDQDRRLVTRSLEADCMLPPDIGHAGHPARQACDPPRRILLTGATGYVGAFILHELLRQTPADIRCFVRAGSMQAGRQRVMDNLRRYGLGTPDMERRLSIVTGDLSAPYLGLGQPAFLDLAASIDSILHSAAQVNFVYPYPALKPANVDATVNLLRLATAAPPGAIAFHFISTMGVVMASGHRGPLPLREEAPLGSGDGLPNGYEQSKYVSDRLVWTALMQRGIPGAIYRPSLVCGPSDGTYHQFNDLFPQALKGCLQLGSMPLLNTRWEMAPVDFVSQAIVHIFKSGRHLQKAYFVTHPESATLECYAQWHRRAGFRLRSLPWDCWQREFLGLGGHRLQDNALYPFADLIRGLSDTQLCFPTVDQSHFKTAIADMKFALPPALTLVERYTRHFKACGFYEGLPSPHRG